MPIYSYVARDLKGEDHQGTIETYDASQAGKILSKKGLIVISVKEKDEGKKKLFDKYFNTVSFNDLVIATRQLATMVESGLVLSEALDILVEQQDNKKLKEVLGDVSRDIKGGLDLATALKKYPDVFPPLYASLVKAGEESGKLDLVLTELATNLEKDREFRSRIKGAMIYPMMIMSMMIVVMGVMMFFVVPRLTSLYSSSNIELPTPTKILITISNFLINFWWFIILVVMLSYFGFQRWVKTPKGKFIYDSFLLRVPVLNKVVQGTSLTYFTRTFGLLTAAGVPLLDSLAIVADVISNAVFKKALQDSFKGVERGLTFSAQLDSTGIFPKIVPQMFKVGEETGKVDKVSFRLAEYFEAESDHLVKNLTVVIEPLILIVLGVAVAFLVMAIILPIYKLTTSF